METVLLTSGFTEPALAAVRRRWQVIDIVMQREALAFLRSMKSPPAAICIGRAVDRGIDLNAWQMLSAVQEIAPGIPVIISTKEHSPKVIVDLVKHGAFDYVLEPQRPADPQEEARYVEELVFALSRAVEWRRLTLENERLRERQIRRDLLGRIKGDSRAMRRVVDLVRKVAPTSATVLITGESGTGKELVARALHALSPRKSEPFVALNCGSFAEQLIAAELFGHVKGAFTGADRKRAGLLQQAGKGTLFLDEIATIPPGFQAMLLRVLEQRVARPVGGNEDYSVHCRFVAAANQDLESLVARGSFREDLYYRLNVFNIHLPPLRERREDIPSLVDFFITEAARKYDRPVSSLTPSALALLENSDWPGNVRQLRNAIERAVIVCEGNCLDVGDFDSPLHPIPEGRGLEEASDYATAMQEFERRLIARALRIANGNRSEAARILGIKRTRLNYRIRRLGLE